jgi:HK97 family phage portal protein
VLSRAREVITAGRAAQTYQRAFYESGGQPSGVLQTEADLTGYVDVPSVDGGTAKKSKRDVVRDEWERYHGGTQNAHRVAVLDYGLKYTPITISQSDAQFVQTKSLNRIDIANFFGVPLYKLNDGKQAYSSNEQNSVDYVTTTLQPKVTQWEQEFSYKLLTDAELRRGKRLRQNMMVAMRGDSASRGNWYKTMREVGAFSVNDILALEDLPSVPGGDTRYASLNYIPLQNFERLSETRNGGNNGKSQA